ncbi:DUF2523 domain-containing protein [Vandammella animalimorsus]|uniref:DUF2523 domain-containing protein n=1 Tax=Vandammella animalimorsus TaxID=2029117 RepID=A0A2A2B0E1_9BURK|nr:DUF2523 domain-containing protein [Vandammella animalimorsus]PAT43507.1 hypothetical protein CK621_03240 [Vandammella animalimorsus]
MNLAIWLLGLVKPIIGRVLLALGISLVTITGFNVTINVVKNQLIGNVNGLPVDLLNLFLYSGMGEAIGIIFGAITTKLLMIQASGALKFINNNHN